MILLRRSILFLMAFLLWQNSSAQSVVITEISYNQPIWFASEDWIELYNNTDETIDLAGWVFKDEIDTQSFVFPDNISLGAGELIVLCIDTSSFKSHYPGVEEYTGNFEWGLSGGGELIRLYNDQGYLIDYLVYNDVEPWPTGPNGNGPTLELIHPDLDNTLPESWRESIYPFGSPAVKGWLGVEDNPADYALPSEIHLFQNFPNPFNPATTLSFYLPSAMPVSLVIYNSSGCEVTRLMDDFLLGGIQSVTFDASGLPSGLYYARLNAPSLTTTQSMILLK